MATIISSYYTFVPSLTNCAITYSISLQGINIIEIYSFLKVILSQKLYHVFLFQYNFYFYDHDIQAVSFNKVKWGEPNWL